MGFIKDIFTLPSKNGKDTYKCRIKTYIKTPKPETDENYQLPIKFKQLKINTIKSLKNTLHNQKKIIYILDKESQKQNKKIQMKKYKQHNQVIKVTRNKSKRIKIELTLIQ